MTQNEREEAIKCIRTQLKNGYVDVSGTHYENELKVIEQAMTALGAIGQYKWELDVAVSQLKEVGLCFGETTDEVQKAVSAYKKIPEIIEELEGLKMSMDGQIFYNQSSKLIYEEKMESTNETVDEAISIVKQLLGN